VLGRGFLLAIRFQIRFSLCQSVLEHLRTLLKCVLKQPNTDNRFHNPHSVAVLGVTLHFCRTNVSTPVIQTSNCCRPKVQPCRPNGHLKNKFVAQTSFAQTSVHLADVIQMRKLKMSMRNQRLKSRRKKKRKKKMKMKMN